MIRSMTAFGRAVGTANGKNYTVEIKSVNNRFLDCSVRLPRNYGYMEEKILEYIRGAGISRGKVDINVGVEVIESLGTTIDLDTAYAEGYISALEKLRDKFGLKDDISTMRVASNRDLFIVKPASEDIERDWLGLLPILQKATEKFIEGREREGKNLKDDILLKKEKVKEIMEKVGAISKKNTQSYREKLETRLKNSLEGLNLEFDSNRILTECAIFADKIAIDEELVRLSSHFKAFEEAVCSDGPVGRRIEFILQEMNREVNTSGSKSNDAEVAALIVDAKCELEKIREQIQNLE